MIRANHRSLEQRPCVLNAIRVNVTAHILFSSMVHRFVFRVMVFDAEIRRVLVRVNLLRVRLGSLGNKFSNDLLAWVLATLLGLHSDRSAALDCSDNHSLVSEVGAESPMLFAANPGLIHFDCATQFCRANLLHGLADAMAEIPSRLVAHCERALELIGRHTLLGFGHQIGSEKPFPERQMGIMEYGSSGRAELIRA